MTARKKVPQARPPLVLLVDDDRRLRFVLARVLERQGYRVRQADGGQQALELVEEIQPDLALIDLHMRGETDGHQVLRSLQRDHPDVVCIILTDQGDASDAFSSLNAGAYDYFEKPIDDWTRFGQVLRNAMNLRQLLGERDRLRHLASQLGSGGEIIGKSAAIMRMRELIKRVASTRVQVLVLGESGTGKELVARALHGASSWSDRPFVDVNCAAIPASLLESELFGHEKGSFTGAQQRKLGLFEVADDGTLFLDEIGELPVELQAKLLRVLSSGSFRRVGGTRNIPSRARVVAATNQDLPELVRERLFREDLLYRLNVIDILVPPLRERVEDIPLLVWFFVNRFNKTYERRVRRITPQAMRLLTSSSWEENNVRQLENAVERAMVLVEGDALTLDLFEQRVTAAGNLPLAAPSEAGEGLPEELIDLSYRDAKALILERFSRAYLTHRLRQTGGNIAEAARRSGQERPNFRKLMKRFGVASPAAQR